MTDVGVGDLLPFVDLPFEREDDEQAVDEAADEVDPGIAPRPDRGSDVIIDRDARLLEPPGQAQVEIGVVDQQDRVGFPIPRGTEQQVHHPFDPAQMKEDLDDPHHGQLAVIDEHIDPQGPETLSADSEKPHVTAPAQGLDHLGSVGFRGVFGRDDQDVFHSPPAYSSSGISSSSFAPT